MSNFSVFGLAAPILKALAQEGYEQPTPIQSQAIPHILGGRDLCGIAQTGTGKTAAFALPILHHLSEMPHAAPRRGCRVLVLSPTRELAGQIAESFRTYGRGLRLTTAVVYGGVPIGKQERQLASGVDVLVATPGRLLDLVDRRALGLRDVEVLVLDEADQMLDLGFIHALKRIVTLLPTERQTLFFSATMPKTIAALADDFLHEPVKVAVTPVATTVERIAQSVIFVPSAQKQQLLRKVLEDEAIERVLVFARTKHGADRVVRHLERDGVEAAAIHGNKSQPQRERALAAFKDGRCRVLVATDIAARGIDVEGVTHVVNFDLPNVPESYVHRIGRTARAGADGVAISFCNGEERAYLRDIEKLTRLKVPVAPLPEGFVPGALDAADEEPGRSRSPQQRRPDGRSAQPRRNGGAQGKGREPVGREAARPSHGKPEHNGRARDAGRNAQSDQARRGDRHPKSRPAAAPASRERGGGGGDIAWLSRAPR